MFSVLGLKGSASGESQTSAAWLEVALLVEAGGKWLLIINNQLYALTGCPEKRVK